MSSKRVIFSCLLALVCLLGVGKSYAQRQVILTGITKDTVQSMVVPNAKIYFLSIDGGVTPFLSDDKGLFSISVFVPDSTIGLVFRAEAENHWTRRKVLMFGESEDTLVIDLIMEPNRVCIDTYLPDNVLFNENSALIHEDQLEGLNMWMIGFPGTELMNLMKRKLEIHALAAWNEPEELAQQRADAVVAELVKGGISPSKFVVIVHGWDDYELCVDCTNQCLYYFQSFAIAELSKEHWLSLSTETVKAEFQRLRQVVAFTWSSKRDE